MGFLSGLGKSILEELTISKQHLDEGRSKAPDLSDSELKRRVQDRYYNQYERAAYAEELKKRNSKS